MTILILTHFLYLNSSGILIYYCYKVLIKTQYYTWKVQLLTNTYINTVAKAVLNTLLIFIQHSNGKNIDAILIQYWPWLIVIRN